MRRLSRVVGKWLNIAVVGFIAFEALSDPQAIAIWKYVIAPTHSPAGWLLLATFALVALDRLERMLASWEGTEK